MSAYYNEIDAYCCKQLRQNIERGLLPGGMVDERDIKHITGADLIGSSQIHLFAGIGGFAYAARLAGLPDNFSILTGGFPCQPFSLAGRRKGQADDRYLWPEMLRVIDASKPRWILGENVPGLDDQRGMVLDRVCDDLEAKGYEVGPPLEIPACAVNAPHRRARLWIVAHSTSAGCDAARRSSQEVFKPGSIERFTGLRSDVEHAVDARSQGHSRHGDSQQRRAQPHGSTTASGFWDGAEWIDGPDGKRRRVKHCFRLVAHGIPERIPKLKALGNSIVPQVAAEIMRHMYEASQ